MGGYAFFNFLVGYALGNLDDPEVKPYSLFTIAIGLHYFVHDHELKMKYQNYYNDYSRFLLTAALIIGWIWGLIREIPEQAVALYIAFVSGSLLLNVARYQLPRHEKNSLLFFMLGAILYTLLLI